MCEPRMCALRVTAGVFDVPPTVSYMFSFHIATGAAAATAAAVAVA